VVSGRVYRPAAGFVLCLGDAVMAIKRAVGVWGNFPLPLFTSGLTFGTNSVIAIVLPPHHIHNSYYLFKDDMEANVDSMKLCT
jgi:hypothetical protein